MKKKPTFDEDALARNVLQWDDVPVSSVGVTYGYGTRTFMATMSQAWVPSTMTTDRTVTIDQPTPRTDWVVERVPPAAPRRTLADEPIELSTRREITLAQKEKP